tara:strand:- start:616 stop:2226 length:1611 start_codon:yes stop_codon:yes gene_type:complete
MNKKYYIYNFLLAVILIASSFVFKSAYFNNLPAVIINILSLFSFTALLMLLHSFFLNILSKVCLTTLFGFFVIAYFAEVINYHITEMTFYEAFWDLLSFSFIYESAKVYPMAVGLFTVLFAFIIAIFWKIMCLQTQDKLLKNKDKVLKVFLILLTFAITLITSSLFGMIRSYSLYQISKPVRSFEYLRQQPEKQDIIAEVGNGKNVVHIILESYADVFTNDSYYPNLTPNINSLKNDAIVLNNMQQINYAKYSEAGNLISNKGRMIYTGGESHPNDIGLTYVLKQAGYYNVFMRGATKNAGGFKFSEVYSKEQGVDEYWTLETFKEKNIDFDSSKWGVKDSSLFKQALAKYKSLLAKEQPFYLGLFTLDTHVDQIMSKECKGLANLTNSDLLNAVSCTDRLVGRFIDELKSLPNFENTLIVIHADHMPYFARDLLKDRQTQQIGLVINSNKAPFVQNKDTYLFDIPQTIISNLEIKTNAKFLLGEDITTSFVREQKTKRETINEFPDLKLNDYSENAFYKIIYNFLSHYSNEEIYQ